MQINLFETKTQTSDSVSEHHKHPIVGNTTLLEISQYCSDVDVCAGPRLKTETVLAACKLVLQR